MKSRQWRIRLDEDVDMSGRSLKEVAISQITYITYEWRQQYNYNGVARNKTVKYHKSTLQWYDVEVESVCESINIR